MKRTLTYLLLLAALLLPSTAMAARVLALTPHACEMIYAIGAEDHLVGAVSYCDYPAAAARLPRIGSYERINVEAALRLKPDVAIAMSHHVAGVERLAAMGITIMISNPDSFEAIFSDILKLGQLTEHQREAEHVVTALRERLQRVRAKQQPETALFYEVWPDPMLTAGGPSFISELIHTAGGRNVFASIDIETPRVNVESVIRAKPALIVIPLEKRDIKARRAFWEKWLGGDNIRIVAIDPDIMHRPGPRLLDGLEQLQRAIEEGQHE